jgi:hypothetical protein
VTWITTESLETAVVGVPEITPDGVRINPAGRVPEVIFHVYGVTPPVAIIVKEYTDPTVPDVSGDVVVIVSDAEAIFNVNALVVNNPRLSVTRIVNEELTAVVGVPDKIPTDDNVSPAGKVPDAKLQT